MTVYGFFYRNLQRLLHHFDLHYAPVHRPILPDGDYQRWCQWCGFRQSFKELEAPTVDQQDVYDIVTGETMSRKEWNSGPNSNQ